MTEKLPPPPSLEKVKEWAAKMEKLNERWDALITIADYMIAELEAESRKQPLYRYRLEKAMSLLNIQPEERETTQKIETKTPSSTL